MVPKTVAVAGNANGEAVSVTVTVHAPDEPAIEVTKKLPLKVAEVIPIIVIF
jgi:hypothetical protein